MREAAHALAASIWTLPTAWCAPSALSPVPWDAQCPPSKHCGSTLRGQAFSRRSERVAQHHTDATPCVCVLCTVSVFKPWCHKRREEKGPTYLESVLEVFQAVLQVPHGPLFQHGEFVSRALGARAPPLRPLQHASSRSSRKVSVTMNPFPNYFKSNVVVSCSVSCSVSILLLLSFLSLIKTPSHRHFLAVPAGR